MEINAAFILAAGFGTRMGEIGKILPKILWPIGGKTILEYQLDYFSRLGIKKVFMNSHHLSLRVLDFLAEKNLSQKVTLIHEENILGVGGAFYNLKEKYFESSAGLVLGVAGDQFLFFDTVRESLPLKETARLFCIPFLEGGYNKVVIKNGMLEDIVNQHGSSFPNITYSGVSLLEMKHVKSESGFHGFFTSVANYKKNKIAAIKLKNFEYIDFGTVERYVRSLMNLQDDVFLS